MTHDTKISVFGVVGSPLCVASSDGQKVYDRLAIALHAERPVALSFHNVTVLTGTGQRKIAVEVVDIFGNNTMTIVEVSV